MASTVSARVGGVNVLEDADEPSAGHELGKTTSAYFADSVYTWACGDKGDQQQDITSSDVLIGWIILLIQALSYAVLISKSNIVDDEDQRYAFASVTVAFYLLVATAAPDLRGGLSMLVDGHSAQHRFFGASLLVVFGLMIAAAMKVLFSSANSDAEIVTNAVTVLFIADVDEKALTFFLTVPQRWRLFWTTCMISISISFALVGLRYVGDASSINKETVKKDEPNPIEFLDIQFVFAISPSALIFLAFAASRSLQVLLEARDSVGDGLKFPWFMVLQQGLRGATNSLRKEAGFYAVLCMLLTVEAIGWARYYEDDIAEVPLAVDLETSTDRGEPYTTFDGDSSPEMYYYISQIEYDVTVEVTNNRTELWAANVVLCLGLAMFALRWLMTAPSSNVTMLPQMSSSTETQDVVQGVEHISNGTSLSRSSRCFNSSRVPSVLVGWGLGYWSASLLFLVGGALPNGRWFEPPVAVSILGFIVLPLAFLCGIFMIADGDFLGARVKAFIGPLVAALKKPDGICHWAMITILLEALFYWFVILSFVRENGNFNLF